MHTDLLNASFSFCSRNELERIQPVSQSFLDMIVAGSKVLPLRPIRRVEMDYEDAKDKIRIFVEKKEGDDEPLPDYEAPIHEGDFAYTFRRLQHTCIREFCIGIHDSPFMRYWTAQATVFTVVSIVFEAQETTYDGLDSAVNHLRPRTMKVAINGTSWHDNGYNSVCLELLARDSFRNSLKIFRMEVWRYGFPPASFILKEPGYLNYEVRCIYLPAAGRVVDGIDGLIESFVRNGCANKILESVSIQWTESEEWQSPVPKQLREPTKIDRPLPKIDMLAWFKPDVHRVPQCEVRFFENTMQWQRMEVYKWSVERDECHSRRTTHILHCLVKDL